MSRQILVVDDDPTIRALLQANFIGRGMSCLTTGDAREALGIVGTGRIDVLVTDLEMPDMDGLTLLRSVRSLGVITRSVVVTGYVTLSNLTACLREGVTAIVPKPLDDLRLLNESVDLALIQLQRWSDQLGAIIALRPSLGQVDPHKSGDEDAR